MYSDLSSESTESFRKPGCKSCDSVLCDAICALDTPLGGYGEATDAWKLETMQMLQEVLMKELDTALSTEYHLPVCMATEMACATPIRSYHTADCKL